MCKISSYVIVEDISAEDFCKKIKIKIVEGYEPYGNPFITEICGMKQFCQAMILGEYEKDFDKESFKEKITSWIIENHYHHDGAECSRMDLNNNTFKKIKGTSKCTDGNSPYVNSLKLVDFINSL